MKRLDCFFALSPGYFQTTQNYLYWVWVRHKPAHVPLCVCAGY